jgi:hypothetical protein
LWGLDVLREEEDRRPHSGTFVEQTRKTDSQMVAMIKKYLLEEVWRHKFERDRVGAPPSLLLGQVTSRQPTGGVPHWWELMNTTEQSYHHPAWPPRRTPPATRWQEVAEIYFAVLLKSENERLPPRSVARPGFNPSSIEHMEALERYAKDHLNDTEFHQIYKNYREYLRLDEPLAARARARPPPYSRRP